MQCRDRLARNAEEYIRIKHILGTYGTKLHFTKASENFENEDDNITELVDFIFASIAELEANLISTRTYHGKRKCIEKNIWPGGKMPYGFFSAPSPYYPKKKIPHANLLEELHVKEIYRLYNVYGYGYTKISKLMNEKFTSRKWTKWDIKNILSNATYTGYIYWDRKGGRRNPNKQKKAIRSEKLPNAEIIGEAIWNETQNLRNRKLELNDPKYFDTPYLLKDKLYCASLYHASIMQAWKIGKMALKQNVIEN